MTLWEVTDTYLYLFVSVFIYLVADLRDTCTACGDKLETTRLFKMDIRFDGKRVLVTGAGRGLYNDIYVVLAYSRRLICFKCFDVRHL